MEIKRREETIKAKQTPEEEEEEKTTIDKISKLLRPSEYLRNMYTIHTVYINTPVIWLFDRDSHSIGIYLFCTHWLATLK